MATKPTHVLHLARWYPHEEDPMLGLFIQNQVKALGPQIESTVIFVWPVPGLKKAVRTEVCEGRVTEIRIMYPHKEFGLANVLTLMKHLFKAAEEVYRDRPYQLVHAHVLTRVAVVAQWVGKRFRVPFLISEHWSRYFPENPIFKGYWRMYFTARMVHDAKALICVSGALRDAMLRWKLKNSRTEIVPNVVDTDTFKPSSENRLPGPLRWINIGCFEDRSKNLSGLLRAAMALMEQGLPFELTLVGDGPDRGQIEALAREMGLHSHVHFTGVLSPKEVAARLAQSDYLVQTSHYETFSTVVAEAWSCGVPVVSTPVGVFADLVNDDNGILAASSLSSDIADALRKSESRKGSFDPLVMREMAVERFGKAAVAAQLQELYQEALAEWPTLPNKD